jgi:hypothetical protein
MKDTLTRSTHAPDVGYSTGMGPIRVQPHYYLSQVRLRCGSLNQVTAWPRMVQGGPRRQPNTICRRSKPRLVACDPASGWPRWGRYVSEEWIRSAARFLGGRPAAAQAAPSGSADRQARARSPATFRVRSSFRLRLARPAGLAGGRPSSAASLPRHPPPSRLARLRCRRANLASEARSSPAV